MTNYGSIRERLLDTTDSILTIESQLETLNAKELAVQVAQLDILERDLAALLQNITANVRDLRGAAQWI